MEGVVKLVPVPNDVPPEETSYQLIVPALAVALKVTVPVPHRELGVVPAIAGVVFTVATTGVLEDVAHEYPLPLFVAST
jgi:hypothetical protein